ncbi:(Fe-S)-binding protein [Thiohalophilus thiocyanatoxydans]|uniref:Glycolate oxidase iron-sulfur subunit n=1 Tax=Thiohalophilus thiocyanatoxydans TaxID=381308 RepID=A0A4V3H4S3_9GAMM|nr:heterodisulfide reductase-related iron-sulfur binding cluster [Thiohalophilus thiocyanatoxydans]TDY04265.1 glycolate oxidase iron-sulfur subunit [Thiohalophilus thiocyanatoxydans]
MQPDGSEPLPLSRQIDQLAEQCVKCGLCLPHCPTYQADLTENESPRGRIALLQALANGQLDAGEKLREHIDHCLLCRRCERVCPSGVQYGRLFDLGQQLLEQDRRPGRAARLGLALVTRPRWLRRLGRLIVLTQRSGLTGLARRLGLGRLSPWLRRGLTLPPLPWPRPFQARYPAYGTRQGQVALFTGCISAAADHTTLHDTLEVLRHFGYEVVIPPTQQCCGALHAHSGQQDRANALATQNRDAFTGPFDAVIVTATGCAAQLREMQPGAPVRDAVSFIAAQPWPETLQLHGGEETVAVHEPCSAQNVLRNSDDSYRLLQRIPGLTVIPLADNATCCGAAGSYLLRYPLFADQLRQHKLEAIAQQKPDRVVTTNIGCALHLQSGLIEQHDRRPVLHPLTLLREYIEGTL